MIYTCFERLLDDGSHCIVPLFTGPDDIRLVNGDSLCSGRVEIRHNGVWGTVCDNSWDFNDASVVCRQLGCITASYVAYNATYGKSDLPVIMSNVQCIGDEASLWKCAQQGWTSNTCPTGRDAGVTCKGEKTQAQYKESLCRKSREGNITMKKAGLCIPLWRVK